MTSKDYAQCPNCSSLRTHITKGEFAASGFQAFGNRVCEQCGTAWQPPCPRWAAIACIVTGGLIVAALLTLGGVVIHQVGISKFASGAGRKSDDSLEGVLSLLFLGGAGVWAFVYGVAVLLGRKGKLKLLGKVIVNREVSNERQESDSSY